jgi:uncharacterized membrane protein YqjE
MKNLLAAAEKLTVRLRILQKLQAQHREMGDTHVELAVGELFESGDLEAIQAFEEAKAEAMGQVPLPMELSA